MYKRESIAIYNLGLALSGGGTKGFAHLGVMKYLDEHGIRPDVISGTSAGAIMGSFYAAGYAPEEIFEIFARIGFKKMTQLAVRGGGFFSTAHFYRHLRRNLPYKRLEDLPIPMRIVATDLDEGRQHIFTHGPIHHIILASCSLPILFKPVEINNHLYVDGGLFRNFPVTVIREECQQIIGMNLGPVRNERPKKNIMGIANRSWELVFRQNTAPDREACDYLLESVEVVGFKTFDVKSASALYGLGYELAKQELEPHLDKLK